MYTLSYMNNFNSEPQQQGKPSVPETKGETIESIAKKLQDVAQQIESVLSEIREANKQPNGPGTSGKLNALRNVFDSLTDEQTTLNKTLNDMQYEEGRLAREKEAAGDKKFRVSQNSSPSDPYDFEPVDKRTRGNLRV